MVKSFRIIFCCCVTRKLHAVIQPERKDWKTLKTWLVKYDSLILIDFFTDYITYWISAGRCHSHCKSYTAYHISSFFPI